VCIKNAVFWDVAAGLKKILKIVVAFIFYNWAKRNKDKEFCEQR
jgi:hypothetical protein